MTETNPIREAAARLKGHWYQGDYRDDAGNACGLGHLFDVLAETEGKTQNELSHDLHMTEGPSPSLFMRDVAQELFPERWQEDEKDASFAIFNDHPDTTEDDVIAVMEKAAVRFDEFI